MVQNDDVLTVKVGASIIEVLQLDSGARLPDGWWRAHDGTEYINAGRNHIRVRGTRAQLRVFQKTCSAGRNFEGPAWYARSCDAAVAAVAKVIGPLHPFWFQRSGEEVEAYARERMGK
jgi:hypothetical protein